MIASYLEYLRYGRLVFWKKDALPLYLILFVTSRCNMRCGHCFNWGRAAAKHSELTLDEYRRISAKMHDLIFMFLSGGEAFLRPDLAEIAELFHRDNRVRKMQTPSNGSLPDAVRRQIGTIARRCPDLHYTVTLSVDGLGAEHDRIRGCPGLFERVMETYRVLRDLQRQHSNVGISFSITLSKANQDTALATYRYLRDQLRADNVYVILTRGEPRDPAAADVNLERLRELNAVVDAELLRGEVPGMSGFPFASFMNAKNVLSREVVLRTAEEGRWQVPCHAGVLAGNVFENGDVYPCELLDRPLGNLREADYDLPAIWRSQAADGVRRHIRETRCFCTHECFMTTNLLFTPGALMKVGRTWAQMRYSQRSSTTPHTSVTTKDRSSR